MKHFLRVFSLLLCLCVLTASLSSCMIFSRTYRTMEEMIDEALSNMEESRAPSADKTEPNENDKLNFTLSEQDRADFDEQLALCRTLTLEGSDAEAIEAAWERLEEMYYHIATQSQIAYILYCCDQSDESASENYLTASEMSGEVYGDYIALCKEIDESSSPYRDEFFSDWTEDEIAEMRGYSNEVAEISNENDRILVNYRNLSESQFESKTCEYYLEFVKNNNRIAVLQGYENYYEYAYDSIYLRDYGKEEIQQMRAYVREYLVPLCRQALSNFQSGYEKLSTRKQNQIYDLLYSDYDSLSTDYVAAYIASLNESPQTAMGKLFEPGNAIFTDSENAYSGAFTGYLYEYEEAICYFGPDYQSLFTVVHELGHYYASQYEEDFDTALDLAETQSQGNEWLLMAYMEGQLASDTYAVLLDYQLYLSLANIILCVIVDEFEETVYLNADDIVKPLEDFDTYMTAVCANYGGLEFAENYITDPFSYWRYVTIESPVYYISYAVSGVAAVGLYAAAQNNTAEAQEIYRKLVEEVSAEDGFLKTLNRVGLTTPFDIKAYISIRDMIS